MCYNYPEPKTTRHQIILWITVIPEKYPYLFSTYFTISASGIGIGAVKKHWIFSWVQLQSACENKINIRKIQGYQVYMCISNHDPELS